MAKRRKSHLLFFLLPLIAMHSIFALIGFPADYLPLPFSVIEEPDLPGYRIYHGESSEKYDHIIDVRNVVLNRSSWEPHVQALFDSQAPSLAKKHFEKSLPYRYSLSIAKSITSNPSLKATMRTSITPLVLLSEFFVMTTLTDKIVYFLFVLCYSLCIFSWLIKRHPDI